MTKHFKNYFYFIILLILLAGFLVWGLCQIDFTEKEIVRSSRWYLRADPRSPEGMTRKREQMRVNLDIPFISQAPYAIWDELHDHACEEAVIIMVYYYLTGEELNRDIGEREILSMVDWQIKSWDGHFDLSDEQIAQLFKFYYNYQNIELVYDIAIENIKEELAKSNPIIIPAAGQLLKNPYFTPPGPEYHILVIKGYDDEKSEFITNDPGTKHGADFRYNYEILQNAIHDYNDGDVLNGKKAMIVIKNLVR